VVNLIAIPVFLMINQLTFWHYGKNDNKGGPRMMLETPTDKMHEDDDVVTRHITMIRMFQNYVTNFAIGVFLNSIKYELSDV